MSHSESPGLVDIRPQAFPNRTATWRIVFPEGGMFILGFSPRGMNNALAPATTTNFDFDDNHPGGRGCLRPTRLQGRPRKEPHAAGSNCGIDSASKRSPCLVLSPCPHPSVQAEMRSALACLSSPPGQGSAPLASTSVEDSGGHADAPRAGSPWTARPPERLAQWPQPSRDPPLGRP